MLRVTLAILIGFIPFVIAIIATPLVVFGDGCATEFSSAANGSMEYVLETDQNGDGFTCYRYVTLEDGSQALEALDNTVLVEEPKGCPPGFILASNTGGTTPSGKLLNVDRNGDGLICVRSDGDTTYPGDHNVVIDNHVPN